MITPGYPPVARFAKRITRTSPKSYGMYDMARRMPDQADLIHLELGRPCYDTPRHIKDAAIASLLAGNVHYSDMQGSLALREAIAHRTTSRHGVATSPSEVLVANGLTQASFAMFMALIDDGDEVIVLDPYYPQHLGKIELAGGVPVHVPLDRSADFAIDAERIEAMVNARTRMIVLVNPNNPTGRVHSRGELEALSQVAIRHDLWVASDEVYEQIVYDGHRHLSIASLSGMAQRTITLCAFTKAYAMDGWRLGYAIASAPVIQAMMKITTSEVTHVNTFIQDGGVAALQGPQEPLQEMLRADLAKRDLVVERLNAMPGIRCRPPQATIYAFPDISETGLGSQVLARHLLEHAHVVVESGDFYGRSGEGCLRICFGAQPLDRLAEAMDRIERSLRELPAG